MVFSLLPGISLYFPYKYAYARCRSPRDFGESRGFAAGPGHSSKTWAWQEGLESQAVLSSASTRLFLGYDVDPLLKTGSVFIMEARFFFVFFQKKKKKLQKAGVWSRGNVNPGSQKPWLIFEGGAQFLLVGIQTTFGGNTPLILGRVYYSWVNITVDGDAKSMDFAAPKSEKPRE